MYEEVSLLGYDTLDSEEAIIYERLSHLCHSLGKKLRLKDETLYLSILYVSQYSRSGISFSDMPEFAPKLIAISALKLAAKLRENDSKVPLSYLLRPILGY